MPDFDCLHRQFQTRLSQLLCRPPPSAGCAATSNPLQWMSLVLPQPNACCRKAGGHCVAAGHQQWFSELLLSAPLSGHSSESAPDTLCCLPPARHRRWGLEIQLDLHSFSCRFRSFAYSMAYSICCIVATSHLFVVYSRGAMSHMCYIAGCHITLFLWYTAHDK